MRLSGRRKRDIFIAAAHAVGLEASNFRYSPRFHGFKITGSSNWHAELAQGLIWQPEVIEVVVATDHIEVRTF